MPRIYKNRKPIKQVELLDIQFPSAQGAIKLATLITTTIALCIFVVIAWIVTRVFGSV